MSRRGPSAPRSERTQCPWVTLIVLGVGSGFTPWGCSGSLMPAAEDAGRGAVGDELPGVSSGGQAAGPAGATSAAAGAAAGQSSVGGTLDPTTGPASGSGGAGASPANGETPLPRLCVFDYDLTLSSNACPATEGQVALHCRENVCDTYGWYPQCLGISARAAVARCVTEGAFIGIASHAEVDACWNDKVTPILTEQQFPELTSSPDYANPASPLAYPALDDRTQWNCETCAYQMTGALAKPDGISRVMRHYGLDPGNPIDRARVLFWDDTPENISAVQQTMPEVRAILVPRNGPTGAEGGCGITEAEIEAGWAP